MSASGYLMHGAEERLEQSRLQYLQAAADPLTLRQFAVIGVGPGWRCVEVGAGAGSMARELATLTHPGGSVLATDIDAARLGQLAGIVDVRHHDLSRDDFDSGAYDLVHCRFVLQHLTDYKSALQRMAAAIVPGGWLVVEEADLALMEMSGAPDSTRASRSFHRLLAQWSTAGIVDSYFGRRVPTLLSDLGARDLAVETATVTGGPGEPAYEMLRLAWPTARRIAASSGMDGDNLECIDRAFANSTFIIGQTTVSARGRMPG